MQIFDADATRRPLAFPPLMAALERLFISGCEVPPRHVHSIGGAQGQDLLTTLIMPAWLPGRYLGIKTVNIAPGNTALGLPGLFSSYLLFDATTGQPLASMAGDEITSRRTAAASALAASRLALPDARSLLVLGAGRVAALLPEAYRAALPTIERVRVWTRRPEAAAALAGQLGADTDVDIEAVTDLARAVAEADIVSCATLATEPLIRGEWLRPGSHLDLIGSFTPAMREADDACFAGASLWVDTDEALRKSGDLLRPLASGVISPDHVRGDLAALCRLRSGRTSASERTVFKSVGSALEDLAAAMLVYEQAAR
ncbi:ornithine cyclodeaminase family protein [Paucibacter sp. PLA-PC-4]|uniref:ornithine cyclodeaminase family protein n=1 Tax=Paucibacter sp. PLA-PC-4 TaxID=2993655 RepID=UPI00224A4A2D|nr:ornithine cyclodeaminase family protein [Paucibacter sp. PLA-PC-4]MCX2863895.1 ornithine cyclodeaminase family protein [Paucibacter sp. PLA-PC-4]